MRAHVVSAETINRTVQLLAQGRTPTQWPVDRRQEVGQRLWQLKAEGRPLVRLQLRWQLFAAGHAGGGTLLALSNGRIAPAGC